MNLSLEDIGLFKAVVVRVEINEKSVQVKFRFCKKFVTAYANYEGWLPTEFITTVVDESKIRDYVSALKLRKGDVIWASVDEEHRIICDHDEDPNEDTYEEVDPSYFEEPIEDPFNETDGYWAVVVNVEKHPSTVRLQFRYSKSCESWPSCIVFETSINTSAGKVYNDALELKKGDEVFAIPEKSHSIAAR